MIKIIKIGADWCKNCNILSNDLHNVNYHDINFDMIDELEIELKKNYGNHIYDNIVNTEKLPTLYIVNNNNIIDKMIGYNPGRKNELLSIIEKYNINNTLSYDEDF